jgi:hypothetical protein
VSKTDNPRLVTVGYTGKNALFTQRGKMSDEGFVRIAGKTISGFHAGKVFYPWTHGKNFKSLHKLNTAKGPGSPDSGCHTSSPTIS